MTVYIESHEYPTVNGPVTAPEQWVTLLNVENRAYGPDIRVTVLNARGSLVRVKAGIYGPYYRCWPEPTAAQLRAILDPILVSVGRARAGRRIETGRWEWLYPTRDAERAQ